MKTLKIRSMTLCRGQAKLICPITASGRAAAQQSAAEIARSVADAAEYRADMSEDALNEKALRENTMDIRRALGEKALMFTYRSEGCAKQALTAAQRRALMHAVLSDGVVDMLDIEHCLDGAQELIAHAREVGAASVYSRHDFDATPSESAICAFIDEARTRGADIAKYACTVRSPEELLRLLAATEKMTRGEDDIPVIAVPMGKAGSIGRIIGGCFGSCMSFCSLGAASAPGQLTLDETHSVQIILAKTTGAIYNS